MRCLRTPTAGLLMLALTASLYVDAQAAEGGKSLYLLGKRGPLAGLIPKPGWYATNDVYYYTANSDELVPISGRVTQGVDVEALVNLLQMTWVTDFDLVGGRLALGVVIPYGRVQWTPKPRQRRRAAWRWASASPMG